MLRVSVPFSFSVEDADSRLAAINRLGLSDTLTRERANFARLMKRYTLELREIPLPRGRHHP